jgi:hypothetical protein
LRAKRFFSGCTAVIAFPIVSAAESFLAVLSLGRQLLRKTRALPRLTVSRGGVRAMGTTVSQTKTGGLRGFTHVTVDFVVNGNPYACRDLRLFAGNYHYKEVGTLYDFPRGQKVELHYNPADPRIRALVVNQPLHYPVVIFGLMSVGFLIMAVVVRARQSTSGV